VNLGLGGTKLGNVFDVNLNGNNLIKIYCTPFCLKNDGIPNIGRNIVLGVKFIKKHV
jgi:iron complex outermembrane receptor protein